MKTVFIIFSYSRLGFPVFESVYSTKEGAVSVGLTRATAFGLKIRYVYKTDIGLLVMEWHKGDNTGLCQSLVEVPIHE